VFSQSVLMVTKWRRGFRAEYVCANAAVVEKSATTIDAMRARR
jgi:hypothetical protein